jgi:hypothetical protein
MSDLFFGLLIFAAGFAWMVILPTVGLLFMIGALS